MQCSNPRKALAGVLAGLLVLSTAGLTQALPSPLSEKVEALLSGLVSAETPGAKEARDRAAQVLEEARADKTLTLSGQPRQELRLDAALEWAELATALENAQRLEAETAAAERRLQTLRERVDAARILHEETVARRERAAAQLSALEAAASPSEPTP